MVKVGLMGMISIPKCIRSKKWSRSIVPYENGAWGPSFSDPNWANTVVPVGLPQANGQF